MRIASGSEPGTIPASRNSDCRRAVDVMIAGRLTPILLGCLSSPKSSRITCRDGLDPHSVLNRDSAQPPHC